MLETYDNIMQNSNTQTKWKPDERLFKNVLNLINSLDVTRAAEVRSQVVHNTLVFYKAPWAISTSHHHEL